MYQHTTRTLPGIAVSTASQARESMLDRIVTRLHAVAGAVFAAFQAPPHHRSFIEENLLDPRVGPEIIRTLRQ